ncbi:MAG: hypothetical protein JST43_06910 [Bacteroidetes bacterium]|nr:hypothetical protein [Bacteroidota bacterium]MBS1539683.1 hypothetical protein [Bacteroidota bacterium]
MPKPHTFPTLYNEALQIHISKLKGWGYLDPEQVKSGTLNWSRNGNKTGSISIRVNTQHESPYLELDYKYNEAPINYRVQLVSAPSNLGKGVVWYFVCPHTGKRCRKLYLADTYFYHREAFRGCMYEKQTQSKKYRGLDKTLGVYLRSDQLFEQLYKKHFKKQYAGKPTKKYLKLTRQIQRAESIPAHEIERALLS